MTWEPSVEMRIDSVTSNATQAMHDLLDRPGPPPADGQPLPILWHWMAFLPQVRQSELAHDGHPMPGTFLPPAGKRRRMYAGGNVTVDGTPRVGASLRRTSRVSGIAHRAGRSGDLMFVTVDHRVRGDDFVITEQSNIVYVDPQSSVAVRQADPGMEVELFWGREATVDPPLLFRFSALTYNAHRIHYDREYATGAEGYPGLVVHGPLQAMLLADAVTSAVPARAVERFSFRSLAPAFDNSALSLRVKRPGRDGVVELGAYSNGIKTMSATAELATKQARG